jgi:hypothetical protein
MMVLLVTVKVLPARRRFISDKTRRAKDIQHRRVEGGAGGIGDFYSDRNYDMPRNFATLSR